MRTKLSERVGALIVLMRRRGTGAPFSRADFSLLGWTDRTLSRALAAAVEMGRIRREPGGWYRAVDSPAELIAASLVESEPAPSGGARAALVLDALRRKGPMLRAELAVELGWDRRGVGAALRGLLRTGAVVAIGDAVDLVRPGESAGIGTPYPVAEAIAGGAVVAGALVYRWAPVEPRVAVSRRLVWRTVGEGHLEAFRSGGGGTGDEWINVGYRADDPNGGGPSLSFLVRDLPELVAVLSAALEDCASLGKE